ncbi:hypothetical protein Tco_1326594 [Tanacetum coccineum]
MSKGNIIKIFYHGLSEITQEVLNAAAGGIFLYKTPNQAYQLLEDKVLLKLDWAKNQKTKSSLKKTVAFADEGSSNSDTYKIMARMDAMTLKMDAQSAKDDLLSEVALNKEAQYKEVRKKSLRDFHKTRLSGSGTVTKIVPSVVKIKPSVTNEGTGTKLGVPDVTEEESTESEAESWGRDEDDSNNDHESRSEGSDQESNSGDDNTQSDKEKWSDSEHETDENEMDFESDQEKNEEEVEDDEEEKDDEFITTPSNSTYDEDETNVELKVKDKAEGDEDEGMDYTANQVDDDVDLRMNEPITTDEGLIQKEGTDAEMINVQQGNENLEITLNQVIEDAHVTLSTITKKTEVPVTSSSYSSDLASEFLKFSDIPHTDAEIISPMDVHVHHEVPSNQKPTLLTVFVSVIIDSSPKDIAKLKRNDPLNTQVTALVDEHLDSRLGSTRDKFMSYLLASITARITEQQFYAKEPITKVLHMKAASSLLNFKLKKILIDKMDEMYSLKRSRKDKDKDEDPSAGSDRGLKKRKTSKDAEPTKEEPEFEVADSDMPQDQDENLSKDDKEPKEKVASKRDWFTKPKQPQEPTDPEWIRQDSKTRTYSKLVNDPCIFCG